jgi:UrcA family protein
MFCKEPGRNPHPPAGPGKEPAMTRPISLRTALGLSAAAALACAAGPTLAQAVYAPSTVDELTVYGPRLSPDGRAATLSRIVSIADLDLRYDRDVREMQRRVRTTARQICDELGESGSLHLTGSTCVDNAVRGAQAQTRIAIAQARSGPYYAYAVPVAPYVAPYAGQYAPPASAYVPEPPEPPEL